MDSKRICILLLVVSTTAAAVCCTTGNEVWSCPTCNCLDFSDKDATISAECVTCKVAANISDTYLGIAAFQAPLGAGALKCQIRPCLLANCACSQYVHISRDGGQEWESPSSVDGTVGDGCVKPGNSTATEAGAYLKENFLTNMCGDCSQGPQLVNFTISPAAIDPEHQKATFTATFVSVHGIDLEMYESAQIKYHNAAGTQKRNSNYHTKSGSNNPHNPTFEQSRTSSSFFDASGNWTVNLAVQDLRGHSQTWNVPRLTNLGFPSSLQVSIGTVELTASPTPAVEEKYDETQKTFVVEQCKEGGYGDFQVNYTGQELNCRQELTKVLNDKQREAVAVFPFLVGGVILVNLVVFLVSRYVYKDRNVDYFIILTCCLAALDFVSDLLFVCSLYTIRRYDFFVVGMISLGSVVCVNITTATYVLRQELRRNPPFRLYYNKYTCWVWLFTFLGCAKANFVTILASGLFLGHTHFFSLPLRHGIYLRFTCLGTTQVLLEDVPQILLVLLLQWTSLEKSTFCSFNIITLGLSVGSASSGLLVGSVKLSCCRSRRKDRNLDVWNKDSLVLTSLPYNRHSRWRDSAVTASPKSKSSLVMSKSSTLPIQI